MISNENLQKYFFNNNYDEKIVNKYFNIFKNSGYTHSLKLQSQIQNIKTIYGTMDEFKVDYKLNEEYGMPIGTYSTKIRETIVPYYNEKIFINKYKRTVPIELRTIMDDTDTFSRIILFSIGQYNIFKIFISITTNECILFIKPTSIDGLTPETMSTFIQMQTKWALTITNQTDYKYTYLIKSLLIVNNVIPISAFTTNKSYCKPNSINSWDVYVSASDIDPNLMIGTSATIKNISNTDCFELSSAFCNYIYANSNNCKCFAINTFQKTGWTRFYQNDSGIVPIIQIPFTDNPVSVDNIMVYEYDSVNDTKGIKMENNISVIYPNIYDFRAMYTNKDMYIEWYNNPYTMTKFDNNFKDYMECYDLDFTAQIINRTAPLPILNYTPEDIIVYDYSDYMESEFYGDVRGYKLSKLIALLHANPKRYTKMIKEVDDKVKNVITGSYAIDTHPDIYTRSVLTSIVQDISKTVSFSEAQTYIIVNNPTNDARCAAIYINGIRIPTTLVYTEVYETYIYFAKKYITTESKIIIDMSVCRSNKNVSGDFTLYDIDIDSEFPNALEFGMTSAANLCFYYTDTKRYIPNTDFTFKMQVPTWKIDYIDNGSEILPAFNENLEYLKSMYDEFIRPTNVDRFRLMPTETFLTADGGFFETSDADGLQLLSGAVTIKAPSASFLKEIDTSILTLSTANSGCIYAPITVANTNFYQKVSGASIVASGNRITIPEFKGEVSKSRFNVYIGGLLLTDAQYSLEAPVLYGDTLTINVLSYTLMSDLSYIVEYLPYKFTTLYFGIPDTSVYVNGIIFLNTLTTRAFNLDTAKIYVAGKRINNDDVEYVAEDAIFMPEFTAGSTLVIRVPELDDDCYEFTSTKSTLSFADIAKTDTTFATYLKNK